MRFSHPQTDFTVKCNFPFLWTLLFGPFYFLLKGNYKHSIISLVVGLCTFGISALIYPFFSRSIMTNYYMEKGYTLTQS